MENDDLMTVSEDVIQRDGLLDGICKRPFIYFFQDTKSEGLKSLNICGIVGIQEIQKAQPFPKLILHSGQVSPSSDSLCLLAQTPLQRFKSA